MFAIEFESKIRDRMIEIPEEQCNQLFAYVKPERVRVIVLASEMPPFSKQEKKHDAWKEKYGSFIEYLTDHPFQISNPVRMTREELHER